MKYFMPAASSLMPTQYHSCHILATLLCHNFASQPRLSAYLPVFWRITSFRIYKMTISPRIKSGKGADGESRTHMRVSPRRILSPLSFEWNLERCHFFAVFYFHLI